MKCKHLHIYIENKKIPFPMKSLKHHHILMYFKSLHLITLLALPNLIYKWIYLSLPVKLQPKAFPPDGKPVCQPCEQAHGMEYTKAYQHITLRQPQTGWDVFPLSTVKSSSELWARCWNRTTDKNKSNQLEYKDPKAKGKGI